MLYLNPDYLAKLFKKETGQALNDYIAQVRGKRRQGDAGGRIGAAYRRRHPGRGLTIILIFPRRLKRPSASAPATTAERYWAMSRGRKGENG